MSARLLVVASPQWAPGYRLAGAEVHEAEDATEARRVVGELVELHEGSVIAVHEPFFAALPRAWRSRLDPLLVALPESARRVEPGSRRARLTAMLEQAIGYHFVFGEGER